MSKAYVTTARPPLKKKTAADVMRRWGLPEVVVRAHSLRYKNPIEKGIYWYYFSLFIRRRDCTVFGTCISCGRAITVDTCDAGHYAPAANCGPGLLFDIRNVNAECSYCNAWDDMHLVGYARNLDARYGEGTAAELYAMRDAYKKQTALPDGTMPRFKDFSRKEYEEKIELISPLALL